MKRNLAPRADLLATVAYVALLLVGIWYGFPNLKIVFDEAPFVGGVLRAIEAMTLVPHIDYSYTLSFYANYLFMLPFLAVTALFHMGDIASTKAFLMEHVYLAYLVPRLVSVVSAGALLALFLQMMKRNGSDLTHRLVLAAIVFGNLIFFVIAHTGKMWLLSLFLWFLSYYFFEKALLSGGEGSALKSPSFWCPVFAFLAFANFPINIIALFFVAWLWLLAIKKSFPWRNLLYGTLAGAALFGLFFFLNHDGWLIQNSIHPVSDRNFSGLFVYFGYGLVALMPLHLLYLFLCTKPRLNHSVVALALSLAAYVALLCLRAAWIGNVSDGYWRYFVYIAFMSGLILAQFEFRRRTIGLVLAAVSLLSMVRVDYLLSIPTTYNEAKDYLVSHAEDEAIINHYPYLDIPKNEAAYLAMTEALCQSQCQYGRETAKPGSLFVVDAESRPEEFAKAAKKVPRYEVSIEALGGEPVFKAENGLPESGFIDMEHGLGRYSLDLWRAGRLGPDFYIYKVSR